MDVILGIEVTYTGLDIKMHNRYINSYANKEDPLDWEYWVEGPAYCLDEFDKWCDDNLLDWRFGWPNIIVDGGPAKFKYWFKNEEDKVKFILKWL